jgi:LysR family transcriptional regulator (chromosome initiation inhibitor)
MLDYKLVEAMAMVILEQGFEKAAHKLHLTQSAISQRIKLLEEQAGQILLIRDTPPCATSAGRRVLKHYMQVKRLEDDLLQYSSTASGNQFASISIGVNEDSLDLWFFDAIQPFLADERVVLDLKVDDQERTHGFLKNGEVVGCISTEDQPMQGCRLTYLGRMNYHLMAAPDFVAKWFQNGLGLAGLHSAPAVIFSRKDDLHNKMCRRLVGKSLSQLNTFYIPSSKKFFDLIVSGFAYGMVPDLQGMPLLNKGRLIDLAPQVQIPVDLYWHCWNLKSPLLDKLTDTLVRGAKQFLKPNHT